MDVRTFLAIASLMLVASNASAKAPARTTSSGAREHWAEHSVKVTLDPSLASMGPHAMDEVCVAFGAWLEGDAALPQFVFEIGTTRGAAAKDGVSRVLATHDVAPGHEKDVAYTVSWANVDTGAILESDIVFNLAYAFGDVAKGCSQSWDTRSVATHEMGHFLGLAEDMADDTTTMWFRTDPCDAHKATLSTTDVAAIESVYVTSTKPVAAHCSLAAPNAPASGGLWVFGAIAALYIRRKRSS